MSNVFQPVWCSTQDLVFWGGVFLVCVGVFRWQGSPIVDVCLGYCYMCVSCCFVCLKFVFVCCTCVLNVCFDLFTLCFWLFTCCVLSCLCVFIPFVCQNLVLRFVVLDLYMYLFCMLHVFHLFWCFTCFFDMSTILSFLHFVVLPSSQHCARKMRNYDRYKVASTIRHKGNGR